MLGALTLPLLAGVYNFGWRTAVMAIVAMSACWAAEYAFTRKEGKPASMAALVTGALLTLTCPPNVPFWQIIVGSAFAIVFGKMVFGGFGRNIFNPTMVGRCFIYISFPITIAATWFVPFQGGVAGFAQYSPDGQTMKARDVEASLYNLDGVTSATVLSTTKKQNLLARDALEKKDQGGYDKLAASFNSVDRTRLLLGNINGSIGETCKILILVALVFLLYTKIAAVPLAIGPLVGLFVAKAVLYGLGVEVMPFGQALYIGVFGGGTLFAITFMTTEPVSAPVNNTARWIYGILIGFAATMIRSLSAFNAGFMFAIMLGNTFGPIIEIAVERLEKARKGATP